MTIWVVRAGKDGERENVALEERRAFVGFDRMDDLTKVNSREKLFDLVEQNYPEFKKRTAQTHAGQLFNFIQSIKIGDTFALPLKRQRAIAFGKFVGDYEYLPGNKSETQHSRRIEWIGDPIPKAAFFQDILYSFGSAMTVFRVEKNDAEKRVKKVISGNWETNNKESDQQAISNLDQEEALDLVQLNHEKISEYIRRIFKGHDMEGLVAAVLRAQGFAAQENTRQGKDGGVDILAGRGYMGFEEPQLCVQVKSGDTAIGTKEYNELKGVLEGFNAKQGLLVSWGGFNREVEVNARRDYFKIRLWTAEDLVANIQDVYEKLPREFQDRLPMQQIWTLVDKE